METEVPGDDRQLGEVLAGVRAVPGVPIELRQIIYTTNAIESFNARFRRAVRHRGHFPNEQAAMKVLYLVAATRRPNRENLTGKNAWKQVLNTLHTHYGDRITEAGY